MTGLIRTYARLRHGQPMPEGWEPTGNSLGHHDRWVKSIQPIGQPPIMSSEAASEDDETGRNAT